MNSNSSGKKLEGFFTGKGFYIVLFLCAAVIGVSAWMMAAGNVTMSDEPADITNAHDGRVETVVIPPLEEEALPAISEDEIEADSSDSTADTDESAVETVEVFAEEPAQEATDSISWLWPVSGEIERSHHSDSLKYDVTMRDWRTHEGIDIEAPIGSTVCAARGGVVESIVNDSLYGTVVTVDHGDGSRAIYANLADLPAVTTGSMVQPGHIIGAVGDTALCEVGQGTHLHFAVTVNGQSANPLDYLPA